jgi:hypothetical protein
MYPCIFVLYLYKYSNMAVLNFILPFSLQKGMGYSNRCHVLNCAIRFVFVLLLLSKIVLRCFKKLRMNLSSSKCNRIFKLCYIKSKFKYFKQTINLKTRDQLRFNLTFQNIEVKGCLYILFVFIYTNLRFRHMVQIVLYWTSFLKKIYFI